MKRINLFICVVIASIAIISCSSPVEKKKSAINAMEKALFSDENKMIDRVKANELIVAYVAFADTFPTAKETPEYLFKAADISMNMNMPQKAIQLFDRIIKDYSDYKKAPQCLFLKGYVYENEIGDLNAAKKIYEDFIAKYPDDEFADDAAISIQNLGKTPEELIREFEEKAKTEGGTIN
jgi:outer membrane protein assembly factor BamD (BamD/ComL family)